MKKMTKLIALLLALVVIVGSIVGCGGNTDDNTGGEQSSENNKPAGLVDYVGSVKLDKNSGRPWVEAEVKSENKNNTTVYTGFVDGDTTHFKVKGSGVDTAVDGIVKARYVAINTPESTGAIEPWGKKASNYTKEKLLSATSIILESETEKWSFDSTGERTLVWVWYKTAEMDDYRNLNIEILQEGLAWGSNYVESAYADACGDALQQAIKNKFYVHNKSAKDPDFYYGVANQMTLKDLKANIEDYEGVRVAFEGVIVKLGGDNYTTAYVEVKDEETGEHFGIQVYLHYNLDYFGKQIYQVGNKVLVNGKVTKYENGGYYQISDIWYFATKPNDYRNSQLIATGFEASYDLVTIPQLTSGTLDITLTSVDEDGVETSTTKTMSYGELTLHSTKRLADLEVVSTYTTPSGNNAGALSITCKDKDGNQIVVRTEVLLDESGNLIGESYFPKGTKISEVRGTVDFFNDKYQLKISHIDDFVFVK